MRSLSAYTLTFDSLFLPPLFRLDSRETKMQTTFIIKRTHSSKENIPGCLKRQHQLRVMMGFLFLCFYFLVFKSVQFQLVPRADFLVQFSFHCFNVLFLLVSVFVLVFPVIIERRRYLRANIHISSNIQFLNSLLNVLSGSFCNQNQN